MKQPLSKPVEGRPAADTSVSLNDPASATSRAEDRAGKPETRRPAEAPPVIDGDLATQLAAIEAQKRALEAQEAHVRKAMWDDGIGRIRAAVQQLVVGGHELPQIAKALGFHLRPAAATEAKSKGPTTNAGWFQTFRTRAIQLYVKQHPELAASLKSQGVDRASYATHLPAADRSAIDTQAHAKADAKCPVPRQAA